MEYIIVLCHQHLLSIKKILNTSETTRDSAMSSAGSGGGMSSTGPGSAMSMSMTTSHRKRHRDLLPEEIMSLKGSGIVVSDGSFSDRIDLGEEEEDPDPDSNVSSGGESEEEIAAQTLLHQKCQKEKKATRHLERKDDNRMH